MSDHRREGNPGNYRPSGGKHADPRVEAYPEEPVPAYEEPYAEAYDEPDDAYDESPLPRGSRRAEKRGRGIPGCLAVLLALVVVVGGLWFGGSRGYHALKDALGGGPEDYAGPGTGKVTFQVHQGDTATAIGRNLKTAGVVRSVDAFVAAANDEPRSSGIQAGYYTLKQKMKASDALAVLIDRKNLVQSVVTIPEGYRVADIVRTLAARTKIPAKRFETALTSGKIGLPADAHGKAEGYLFPATYDFGPDATPVSMLKAMVDRWRQAVGDNDVDAAASALGRTPQEIMTVASLVQSEGRTPDDMAKIARVIYNRIDHPSEQGTGGKLQIDATVDYALGRPLTVGLTNAERTGTDSPYNTYVTPGLPPGPIGSPGDDAIQAALHPADGDWYFYITVNLKTGETKFARTYSEFEQYNAELQEYCQTQSKAC